MLVIQNIKLLEQCVYMGRMVDTVEENTEHGRSIYSIKFPSIPLTSNSIKRIFNWEDDIELRLDRRTNKNGKYELYVMGWMRVTTVEVDLDSIRSYTSFDLKIREVLKKYKAFF